MKTPRPVFWSTVVAALGGLLFGFDTAVISGTTGTLERIFDLDSKWLGFTVASALIGTIVGSIAVGKSSARFSRKSVLLVLAVFFAVSAVGSGLAWDWYSFLFFRFLGGIGVGGASVASPMYIAEISPAKIRGRLVAVQQFNVCFGICLAYLSNFAVASMPFIPDAIDWRWMFAVEAFPATVFFVLLFFIPNSPRWLVERQRVDDARRVLERLQAEDVEGEIAEIIESLHSQYDVVHEPLFARKYHFPLMAAVVLGAFNQLTGINALLYYAPKVFSMGNSSATAALLQSIPVGIMLVVSTMIGMAVIDKYGRKTLLLVGSVGMVVFLGLVAMKFYTVAEGKDIGREIMWYFIGYILFFGFSQGAVIWVFISEIVPNKIRARGQGLGSVSVWVTATLITLAFPTAADCPWIGPGHSFAFFSVMMVLQFVFVWKVLPETKGISLEQIQKQLDIE
jgi:sugar porter (SP) family MFS transporter